MKLKVICYTLMGIVCGSFVLIQNARAQNAVSTAQTVLEQSVAKNDAVSGGPTGAAGPGLALSLPTLQLSLTDGKGELSASYNRPFIKGDGTSIVPFSAYWGIKIAVPTSDSSNTSSSSGAAGGSLNDVASSSQLPNGFKASFPLSFIYVGEQSAEQFDQMQVVVNQSIAACQTDKAATLVSQMTKAAQTAKVNGQAVPPNFVPRAAASSCSTEVVSNNYLLSAYPTHPDGTIVNSWNGSFVQLTVTPAAQYVTSNYYVGSALSQKSTKHVLPSIDTALNYGTAGPSFIPGAGFLIVTPEFDYGITYKDNASKVECVDKSGAAILTCVNGPIGAPKISKTEAASLSIKLAFPTDFSGFDTTVTNVVLIPKYTYDAAIGGTLLDLPIYFVLKSSASVFPGIDMNWTNQKHDFTVGAFLATSLGS